jgi:hypothetical protein
MDELGVDVICDQDGNPVVDYCYIRVPIGQEHSDPKTTARTKGLPLYPRRHLNSPRNTAEMVKQRILGKRLEFISKQLVDFVKLRKRKYKKQYQLGC